jgi:polygalacturonase
MNRFIAGWIVLSLLRPIAATALELNAHDFGAISDGKTLNTRQIQQAIDHCSEQGGGTVKIPAGQFVCGTILLKDNVTLQLDEHATLLGSLDITDYTAPDKFRSGNGAEMGHCFIGAVGATNVAVIGAGVIDGRGKELLAARPKGNSARPFLMRFVRCEGVLLQGIHLQGPAAWTTHFFQCKKVHANEVSIVSRGLANNDGFDIDSSQYVRITNCRVDSGDDSICFKTTSAMPCQHVTVSGCDLKSHWGGVKFGTESVGDFEYITISNCRIHDAQGGIKLFSVDGANARNIIFNNLTMENVNTPIFIRLGARLKTFREGDAPRTVGSISSILIQDLKAQAVSPIGILISGIPGHPVSSVRLANIEMKLPGGGARPDVNAMLPEKENGYPEITMFGKELPAYGLYARHVTGLTATNVVMELAAPDLRPAIFCEDAKDLEFSNWKVPTDSEADCLINFQHVRKVKLSNLPHGGRLRAFMTVGGEDSGEIEQR